MNSNGSGPDRPGLIEMCQAMANKTGEVAFVVGTQSAMREVIPWQKLPRELKPNMRKAEIFAHRYQVIHRCRWPRGWWYAKKHRR